MGCKISVAGLNLKLLRICTLTVASILAFSVRLFSVLRYEVVIHEFDPYFNYVTTKYLAENGFYRFLNWFDDRAWYPLGRIIGGTIYPGLMLTSTLIHHVLLLLNFSLDISNVCVFVGPLFSCFTTIVTYHLTSEIADHFAGLLAAAFISIVPGYISRSVAGSYDNEAIAIFSMLATYYCWIKSVKSGSIFWSTLSALTYFYMVSSWGGYVFLINLIPFHVFTLIILGRFDVKVYVSYSIFYVFGTLFSMQIPFVGFQPTCSSEHMAAFVVFGLAQVVTFRRFLQSKLSSLHFQTLARSLVLICLTLVVGVVCFLALFSKISPWTGRFYSLLDPSYAKKNIPIIASVSEHQPTSWSSFYLDLHLLIFLFPLGIHVCLKRLSNENIFIVLYGITSIYFTGVMVRLMLVLAPVMCIVSAIGLSRLLCYHTKQLKAEHGIKQNQTIGAVKKGDKCRKNQAQVCSNFQRQTGQFMIVLITGLLISYAFHSIWVSSEAYSSPSIVLSGRSSKSGTPRITFDDFREAYYWLRMNTLPNAKIMCWWDYGYQISAMANRTTIVDNNTWNNTHISLVAQAMASNEKTAHSIAKSLDVDYVLVLFGGIVGYASDDLNKFLWMIRIAGSTPGGKHIVERNFLSSNGEFRVDKGASSHLTESLMYKLSYYQFGQVRTQANAQISGYDRVRQAEIGIKNISLSHFAEVYTTEHWLVRIYSLKKLPNRS